MGLRPRGGPATNSNGSRPDTSQEQQHSVGNGVYAPHLPAKRWRASRARSWPVDDSRDGGVRSRRVSDAGSGELAGNAWQPLARRSFCFLHCLMNAANVDVLARGLRRTCRRPRPPRAVMVDAGWPRDLGLAPDPQLRDDERGLRGERGSSKGLRGRKAERLEGDPYNLIRSIPAKGNRLADCFACGRRSRSAAAESHPAHRRGVRRGRPPTSCGERLPSPGWDEVPVNR